MLQRFLRDDSGATAIGYGFIAGLPGADILFRIAGSRTNCRMRLEESLKDLFLELDGSGGKMLIESFERPGAGGTLVQYSIFVEPPPLTSLEFGEDQPRRKTRRPVIEAVLCYDLVEGSVDIVAKGGAPVRKEIGEVFICNGRTRTTTKPCSARSRRSTILTGRQRSTSSRS